MKETARQVCVAKTFALACAVASAGIGSLQAADAYIYDTAGGTANLGAETQIEQFSNSQRFIVCQGTVNINEGAYIKVGGNTSNICNYIGVDRNNATAVVNINGGTFWCTTEGGGSGYLAVGGNNYTLTASVTLNSGTLKVDGRIRSSTVWNSMNGASCSGTVNVNGGEADVNELFVGTDSDSTGTSALNLNGGTLGVNTLSMRSFNNQIFNWGSGTLVAKKDEIFQVYDYKSMANTRTMTITGAPAVLNTASFTQTVPAEFTGNGTLKITGGGTVSFQAHSLTYGVALDNATLNFASSSTLAVGGKFTLGAGAKIACDVSRFRAFRIDAADGIELPDGAAIADFVEVKDGEVAATGYTAAISGDGKSILVYKPGEVFTATWIGDASSDAASAASWTCRDAEGNIVANAVPDAKTIVRFSGEFAANIPAASAVSCGRVVFENGAKLAADSDLSGLEPALVNLIKNGTFEGRTTDQTWGSYASREGFQCDNWTFSGGAGLCKPLTTWTSMAGDLIGEYALFMQNESLAQQSLGALPAGSYRVTFKHAVRNASNTITTYVELVEAGGTTNLVGTVKPGSVYMYVFNAYVQLDAGTYTFQLRQPDAGGDRSNIFEGVMVAEKPAEMAYDGQIDLNGHSLKTRSLTGWEKIVDGSEGGGGAMVLDVPEGENVDYGDELTSRTIEKAIADNVKIVKSGAGAMQAKYLRMADYEDAEFVQNGGAMLLSGGTDSSIGGWESAGRGHGVYRMNGGLLLVGWNFMMGSYGLGEFYQTDGNVVVPQNWMVIGRFGSGKGVYTMTGGTVRTESQGIIVGEDGDGTLYLGGTGAMSSKNEWRIASNAGSKGAVTISDEGSFMAYNNTQVGRYGQGTLTQDGGTFQCNAYLSIGRFNGGKGVYTMTGGSYTSPNYVGIVGEDGDGTLDVSGTAVADMPKGLNIGQNATGVGRVNVHDGGKLITPYIWKGTGSASLSFDGGTLQVPGDGVLRYNFFQGPFDFSVGDGGMTLDVGNNNVIATASNFSEKKIGGTITKTGTGSLVMDALPPVEKLKVNEGKLVLPTSTKPVLAHRWSFNGDLNDAVTGVAATQTGTVSFTDDGKQVYMEGGNRGTSVIDLGANKLPSNNVTIELWTTLRTTRSWCKMFCLGKDTSNGLVMTYNKSNASGPTALEVIGKLSNVEGTGTMAVNVPYHVALTITPDGVGGSRVRVYIRNTATGVLLGTIDNDASGWTVASLVQNSFLLGRSFWNDADSSCNFDEVRVWDGVFTDEQLAANAMLGPDTLPGETVGNVVPADASGELVANNYLLHRWSFNDSNGKDLVGGNDAVFKGTTLPVYKDGTSVRLAGGARGTSWIDLGSNIVPGGDVPFTIELWTTPQTLVNWCQAFAFGTNGKANDAVGDGTSGLIMGYRRGASPNYPSFRPVGADGSDNYAVGTTLLTANVEYHMAIAVTPKGDGNSSTLCAYIFNARTGELIGSETKECTNWTTSKIIQDGFRLGHSWWNDQDAQADYNEVRVWGAALSGAQLAANNMYGPDVLPKLSENATLETQPTLDLLDVAAGATVDLGGHTQELGNVSGVGTIVNGTLRVTSALMPGGDGAAGTLTLAANTVVVGELRLDEGDMLAASGTLDLREADIVMLGDGHASGIWTIARSEADGGIIGPAKSVNVKGYKVSIKDNGKTAILVRERTIIYIR